jgi:predicted peptidase
MFQRLRELKRSARLTVLEGVDHAEVETAALSDPQLLEWLLQQQLEVGDDAEPQ